MAGDGFAAPRHVAIIMDGNGRWAAAHGLPRVEGHRRGVEALRRTVRAAGDLGIAVLTIFSFSSENWSRPLSEIRDLMGLLRRFIRNDLADLHKNNVRVRIIGERKGLERDAAGRHLGGKLLRGTRDLLARAVIEGDDERELVVVPGQILRFFEQAPDVGREIVAIADDAHMHAVAVEVGQIVANEAPQQAHQLADFGRRPRPVFGAEREYCQYADAEIAGGAHRAPQRLHAAPMSLPARQAARRGPAPVAIHDDGHVPWNDEFADRNARRRLRHFHHDHTVRISLSLPASSLSISPIVSSVSFWTCSDERFSSSSLIL